MKYITLTKGARCKVDDDVYKSLGGEKWHLDVQGYAARRKCETKERKLVRMHREIMHPPKGMWVDHKNGDRLDNRRVNLRICTPSQNCCNKGRQKNNKSGVKGVHWSKQKNRWAAQVKDGNKRKWLGFFKELDDAHSAYKRAARELHKEFARFS